MNTTKKISELDANYSKCCDQYIKFFCDKQDISYTSFNWIHVNEMAMFIDQYFFNMQEIIYDVNTNQPQHQILEWQDHIVEYTMYNKDLPKINYSSYCMGERYDLLKNNI